MNGLLTALRVVVLLALLVLVGPWALHTTTPDHPPSPRKPAGVQETDLARQQRELAEQICARAMAAGATSCKEIDGDGRRRDEL